MNAMKTLVAVLLIATYAVAGQCPFTVRCSIDGMMMNPEGCEYNYQNHHKVCKFGHDHYENSGMVHHYQYVDCG